MSDSSLIISRLFMLLFVPTMLLAPVLFVFFSRNRAESEGDRAAAASRLVALCVATVVGLGIWLGLLLASLKLSGSQAGTTLHFVAQMSWVLFFPLWFGFAMPTLRSRNPAWKGPHDPSQPRRTASLVPRERRSPITTRHWVILVAVTGAIFAAILARGWAAPFADEAGRWRWLVMTIVYGFTLAAAFIVQPFAFRAALNEPEPLDAAGSPELVQMYDAFRTTKLRGLFWMVGFALPVLMGAWLLLAVWVENSRLIATIGASTGVLLGLVGAWFGAAMSVRRVRIAEAKARLERDAVAS